MSTMTRILSFNPLLYSNYAFINYLIRVLFLTYFYVTNLLNHNKIISILTVFIRLYIHNLSIINYYYPSFLLLL